LENSSRHFLAKHRYAYGAITLCGKPFQKYFRASQDQMAKIVDDWQSQAKKLSDAGYLVIDSTAVVTAPDDVYVRQTQR
jgi:hypothetical protein